MMFFCIGSIDLNATTLRKDVKHLVEQMAQYQPEALAHALRKHVAYEFLDVTKHEHRTRVEPDVFRFSRPAMPAPCGSEVLLFASRCSAKGRDLFGVMEEGGVHVLPAHYYSPIPHMGELAPKLNALLTLDQAGLIPELPGVDLRPDAAKQTIARCAARYTGEFAALPREVTQIKWAHEYYLNNPGYGAMDGAALHCMLRDRKPKRLIEIGMGYSTMLSVHSLALNARESGSGCKLTSIEPYPKHGFQKAILRGLADAQGSLVVVNQMAQDVPLETYLQLEAGDVLFIDCSHIVRLGSDTMFLFTQVLPRLARGVLVHVHDVFLPYEYPGDWIKHHRFWNEQYFLHMFLAHNSAFRVVMPVALMSKSFPGEFSSLLPPNYPPSIGGGFWIERVLD